MCFAFASVPISFRLCPISNSRTFSRLTPRSLASLDNSAALLLGVVTPCLMGDVAYLRVLIDDMRTMLDVDGRKNPFADKRRAANISANDDVDVMTRELVSL